MIYSSSCIVIMHELSQANPFSGGGAARDLALFVDRDALGEGAFQKSKITMCLSAEVWSQMEQSKMPNLCGGTIFGSAKGEYNVL